jgi:anti-sigma factor RsiW
MDTGHSGDLAHRRVLENLPWYVNGQLEPEEFHRVETHLGGCAACRREADGLAMLLSTHAAAIPDRPVDEARLDALFARIDRYEATRRERLVGVRNIARPSLWQRFREALASWLTMQPALVAGAFAAVLLAAVVVPVLRSQAPEVPQYEVLGPATDALSIRVRFQTAADATALERLIEASRTEGQLTGQYRIEKRTSTEYVVVFEQKPGIEAVSKVIQSWRSAPNVTEVAIDDGVAGE